MFKHVKTEVQPLTQELAKEFQAMKPSPTEREIKPARLKHLSDKIQAGLAIPFHWDRALYQGEYIRVNGQHSSNVLAELGDKMPDNLVVVMTEYNVEDVDGLATLFRQFDDRKSSRGAVDVAGAYKGLFPELSKVPVATAKLACEGIAWYRKNIEQVEGLVGDDQYTYMSKSLYWPFMNWLGRILTSKTPELKNRCVVAAMLGTFETNQEEALTFWDMVARGGDEYDDQSPVSLLDIWLRRIHDKDIERVKPGEFYQACVHAWNSWREEKSPRKIHFDISKGFHKISL